MIDYSESIDILNKNIKHIGYEKLFIDKTLGRVLAQDIIADENSPSYPTSAMDGYAIKHTDLNKKRLTIIDINPAGTALNQSVREGACIKTFTGSLMPNGSDTLIPIENVSVDGSEIIINQSVPFGFSVRAIGENYAINQVLIKKNTVIDFAHIGVIASLNIATILVYQKPRVATLSTGSEILDIAQKRENSAQIRSSNHLTIAAIATKYGADVAQLGVISDDKNQITKTLKSALKYNDIVVTTGGVSVGDYDFVKDIINDELGATLLFKGVNIKPGRHIMIAQKDNKFIIGLPGFAYSSTVTFLLYALPIIFKMQNSPMNLPIIKATLSEDFSKRSKFSEFTACNLEYIDGEYLVDFKDKKIGSSAILTNMLGGSALMILDKSDSSKSVGDIVDVIKI